MSLRPKPTTQAERNLAEQSRQTRERKNQSQGFLQLPPELRNEIYTHLLSTSREYTHNQGYTFSRHAFPSLMHVSRQTRADIIPMFFGGIVVSIYVPNLILQSKSSFRLNTITNVLCDRSIASLRIIKLHSRSMCWHDIQLGQKAAGVGWSEITIDRANGAAGVTNDGKIGGNWRSHCCVQAREDAAELVIEEARFVGLSGGARCLRRSDFDYLGQRLSLGEARPRWKRLWSGLRGRKV